MIIIIAIIIIIIIIIIPFTCDNGRGQVLYFFLFINAVWNCCELYSVLFCFVKDKSVISAGMVASEASKGMGPDEESFNVPVPVTQKVHSTLPCVLNFKQIINNN